MTGTHAEHISLAGAPQRHLDAANAIDTIGRHPCKRDTCVDLPGDNYGCRSSDN